MSDWRERARCAETNPEDFFPDVNKPGPTREAKKICASCDVRVDCLDWALAMDMEWGIWGGLTSRERVRLKNASGVTEPKVCALPECDDEIPPGSAGNKRFCTDRHARLSAERRQRARRRAA